MKKKANRVSLKEKISWGLGGFSEQVAVNGLNNLFMPVFNIGFGMDSKLIGWAMTIPRFFDMISDPLVGNMSDNCRSRFGRRRPFIFIGGILMALIFGLTYMVPPQLGQWAMFGYATVSLVLFYLAYTTYSVPYTALGLELTDDYDQRAHIQKYRCIFNSLATFTLPWVYKLCIEAGNYSRELHARSEVAWYHKPLMIFDEMAGDLSIKAEVLGSRYVAWGCALFIICAILPVSFFVKERCFNKQQATIRLMESAKMVSKNRPFLLLCGMILLVITGNFFVNPLLMYLNVFYVCGGDKAAGATLSGMNGSVLAVAMFFSAFFVPYLVEMQDKKKVLLLGLFLGATANLLNLFLVNPNYPYLQLISAAMLGFGLNCCWLLNGAFIADICDQDELEFGYRREGMFAAVFGFIVKLAFMLIGVALGYLLAFSGYQAGADSMSPETITKLRYFLTCFPMACLICAALIFKCYPLTRERIHEIQVKLNSAPERQ